MSYNFGQTLDSVAIERGLRELNPNMHFDMGTALGQWHPYQASRQGVFYEGRHICSMDRGIVPEFKQWSMQKRLVPVDWSEADKDDVRMQYQRVLPGEPGYIEAFEAVERRAVDHQILPTGAILKMTLVQERMAPKRVVLVGWRHTFEGILRRDIPGITRQSLAAKFGVDMLKYPVGTPEDVIAALVEE